MLGCVAKLRCPSSRATSIYSKDPNIEPKDTQRCAQLADVFDDELLARRLAEVDLQPALEQLEQHLEADLGDGGVIPPLGQLIPYEGMLGAGNLVEREIHTGVVQRLADEVAARGWDVVVALAEDHDELAVDVARALEAVVSQALAEAVAVDVGGEVAHGGAHALVQRAAVREVAAQTHARGADAAVAGLEAEEQVD